MDASCQELFFPSKVAFMLLCCSGLRPADCRAFYSITVRFYRIKLAGFIQSSITFPLGFFVFHWHSLSSIFFGISPICWCSLPLNRISLYFPGFNPWLKWDLLLIKLDLILEFLLYPDYYQDLIKYFMCFFLWILSCFPADLTIVIVRLACRGLYSP